MMNTPLKFLRRLFGKPGFDCNDVMENCSDYADGELAPKTRAKFDAHLLDCPDCPEFVRSFLATLNALRNLPRLTPAPSLKDRIRSQIASSG